MEVLPLLPVTTITFLGYLILDKMLGQSSAYKNSYVSKFYFKMDMFTDEQVKKAYYNKNYKLINKVTNAAITENKFNDQFLCVSFFESITRTVFVQKED